MNKKKIAILGAGPSGLAQLRAFEAARLAGAKDLPEMYVMKNKMPLAACGTITGVLV